MLLAFEKIENGLGLIPGYVDPNLSHRRDGKWTQRTWLQAGAFRHEVFRAKRVQKRLGHSATSRVLNANEENGAFHGFDNSFGDRNSHVKSAVATSAPSSSAAINAGTSRGAIPANVLLNERAIVTAGFANDVEAVNQ